MINTYILQFYKLPHLPHSDYRSDQWWLSHDRKPRNFASNLVLYPSNSKNIGPIATLKVVAEMAHTTAHMTYGWWHDTIRTQRIIYGQSWATEGETVKSNRSGGRTWPKTPGFTWYPGDNLTPVRWFGFPRPRLGPLVQFLLPLHQGTPESLLTVVLISSTSYRTRTHRLWLVCVR